MEVKEIERLSGRSECLNRVEFKVKIIFSELEGDKIYAISIDNDYWDFTLH